MLAPVYAMIVVLSWDARLGPHIKDADTATLISTPPSPRIRLQNIKSTHERLLFDIAYKRYSFC